MLSNILDEKSQVKINEILGKFIFPMKCYSIIIIFILLLISYYLYKISEKLN